MSSSEKVTVHLAYGSGRLAVDFPAASTDVIEPSHAAALPDERGAVMQALWQPIVARALRECVNRDSQVCVLFTDITRATPNERLIPWVLEHLDGVVPRENITLLNQLGTHRPNTTAELERMLTPDVVRKYRVLNHEPENPNALVQIGTLRDGTPAMLNRTAVQADLRVLTGFIEPHFFAGFSGGPKGLIPGVAGLRTVMSNHGARNLGDPNATFGVTRGNPLWEELCEVACRVDPNFLVNVALNDQRQITGVFAGDLVEAHQTGCEFVRQTAMRPCPAPYDLVVTSNSGYPLDLNLYQGVKGMSAAARIVRPGGTILLAAECREGVPPGSSYDRLLRSGSSPEALLHRIMQPGFSEPEQWQANIQLVIQSRARVLLHSSLPEEAVRAAHLEPCRDIGQFVAEFTRFNPGARIAVLPLGPLTIPYLSLG